VVLVVGVVMRPVLVLVAVAVEVVVVLGGLALLERLLAQTGLLELDLLVLPVLVTVPLCHLRVLLCCLILLG
jgi:predicted tellurium resistance membrane protein TerC